MIQNPEDILLRILIVDDDLLLGELVSEFLIEKGYDVFYASNGDLALEFIKRARPHIVLLDIQMDGMDGMQVLRRIVDLDSKVGVMMVTAYYEEDIGREALQLGAVDYITKPVDFEYLDTSLKVKLSTMLM